MPDEAAVLVVLTKAAATAILSLAEEAESGEIQYPMNFEKHAPEIVKQINNALTAEGMARGERR